MIRKASLTLGFIVLALFVSQGISAESSTGKIKWHGFDDGLKLADSNKKYAFVEVYTDWCSYCKMMEEVTFQDASVLKELKKDFVSIKLNAESETALKWQGQDYTQKSLADTWGVYSFPTLLFLKANGDIVGTFPSYAEPDLMQKLLRYISSGARERNVAFEDFLGTDES